MPWKNSSEALNHSFDSPPRILPPVVCHAVFWTGSVTNMSDPFLKIPGPSLPEHSLLRDAGALPQLTSGLRKRVVLNVHKQVRYGRWADRARVAGSVIAACLVVLMVWNFRWTGHQKTRTSEQSQDTVQHDAPTTYPAYISPGRNP